MTIRANQCEPLCLTPNPLMLSCDELVWPTCIGNATRIPANHKTIPNASGALRIKSRPRLQGYRCILVVQSAGQGAHGVGFFQDRGQLLYDPRPICHAIHEQVVKGLPPSRYGLQHLVSQHTADNGIHLHNSQVLLDGLMDLH